MTIEEIKELLKLFNDSGVAELELQRGDDRLRLRRAGVNQEYVVLPPGAGPVPGLTGPLSYPQIPPVAAGAGLAGGAAAAGPAPGSKPSDVESGHTLVKSPIVGTYYDAPSPDASPFVRVGDAVEPGQVLCIIESMKLMNEIESEVAGVVTAKLVENGRPVEYGEALFSIRPR
jgi:acetyl-CoA carboxylase biotin carboxyl carrier protein